MDESILQFARGIIAAEAAAVLGVAGAVDESFVRAAEMILHCPASLLVTGVGKAGHVARKLSATFSSTGAPSHFLSPTDAVHGDLGSLRQGDVVLILSASGESEEILRLLSLLKKLGHPVIAITCTRTNTLARHADIVLAMGEIAEACPLGLAPSASTTAMMAMGDALALSVMHLRQFTAEDFARFHPAGQLGRKLIKVGEAMTFRKDVNLPVASDRLSVADVLRLVSTIKRRSGAVILVDDQQRISGIFTDGDLRRLVTADPDTALRRPIAEVMKPNPLRIAADRLASEAMSLLHKHRIDELPVVDEQDRPLGLIDVQDLVVLKMLDDAADGSDPRE
ncbi:MAG: KpsF/GutQ family sugar-phosphate isomerase [Phycisphaerales bacterium]|jgi:arabinose-5-phosphate isomerase|nr:KpsF/GutQ family sugar-phosphate isomerase [Phycisphaerales bacterium]